MPHQLKSFNLYCIIDLEPMATPGLFEGVGPLPCVDDGVEIKLCTCALVF